MTAAPPVPTVTGGDRPARRQRRLVAGLALSQTIGYGTLTYAFAVLLHPLADALGTSTTVITGALALSIGVGAVLAVPTGRWLDRYGGRALMTTGSAAGALLLAALAHVRTVGQLYVVLAGIGAAAVASRYEAAFAVLVARFAPARRASAILAVTVVAGFASSIFLPLTGWLVDAHGWRTAVLVLAGVQAVTVPIHALLVPRRNTPSPGGRHGVPLGRAAVRAALADRGFWLLTAGFTAQTAAVTALTVHLVAALTSWGHRPTTAATIAGLLGVLSVTGRLAVTGLTRRWHASHVTAAVFAVQAVSALALPAVGAHLAGAVGAVIGLGLGFGVATIAKPVLLAERYDTRRYATLAGILLIPITLAKAAAPLAAAALHTATGDYTPVLTAIAACCALAAAALAATGPPATRSARPAASAASSPDPAPGSGRTLRAGTLVRPTSP
ncbi:MAG TPA: MFS transporter [Pilimelia sp.]|nr:MFS transporter [Pilimelia sp.]